MANAHPATPPGALSPFESVAPRHLFLEGRSILVLLLALAVMYAPTYMELSRTIWASAEQGHGPIIFALSLWLLWYDRSKIFGQPAAPALPAAFGFLSFGLLLFLVGRTQEIIMFEVGSQIPILLSCLLLLNGWNAVRKGWFPLFFLIFMIPLPEFLVSALTGPLRSAVSVVAEGMLYAAGYPIGRTGVILSIGPYQLMVADACAGLNSMFTLESLGLLYMKLMNYTSPVRNTILAVTIIPISFMANVVRVIVLVLITYYFGDEAGQGFSHSAAGMVLFLVALMLIILFDKPLGWFFKESDRVKS